MSKSSSTDNKLKMISLLLRIGLAFVFAYAAIDAFREPNAWISFVPEFSTKFISAKVSLDLLSLSQLVLVAALLLNQYIKYAALLAIAFLGGLMVFNPETFLITFRDVGLIFMAGALYFTEK
ncbi:MAG: hypothetical protein ABIV43_00870 [Candidatus Saccharimonadales bacterium]